MAWRLVQDSDHAVTLQDYQKKLLEKQKAEFETTLREKEELVNALEFGTPKHSKAAGDRSFIRGCITGLNNAMTFIGYKFQKESGEE